jgi:hypothetical protein
MTYRCAGKAVRIPVSRFAWDVGERPGWRRYRLRAPTSSPVAELVYRSSSHTFMIGKNTRGNDETCFPGSGRGRTARGLRDRGALAHLRRRLRPGLLQAGVRLLRLWSVLLRPELLRTRLPGVLLSRRRPLGSLERRHALLERGDALMERWHALVAAGLGAGASARFEPHVRAVAPEQSGPREPSWHDSR